MKTQKNSKRGIVWHRIYKEISGLLILVLFFIMLIFSYLHDNQHIKADTFEYNNNFTTTVAEEIVDEQVPHFRRELTNDEYLLLLKTVYAEVGNSSFDAKAAVASVILNRLDSPNYPNSLEDVIFQKGQFETAQNGNIYTGSKENRKLVTLQMLEKDSSLYEAVYAALIGYDPSEELLTSMGEEGGALFFYQDEALSSSARKERGKIKNKVRIGTELFYRTW